MKYPMTDRVNPFQLFLYFSYNTYSFPGNLFGLVETLRFISVCFDWVAMVMPVMTTCVGSLHTCLTTIDISFGNLLRPFENHL